MDKRNGLKAAVLALLVMACIPASAGIESYGGLIIDFVKSSFLGGALDNVKDAGSAAAKTVKSLIPFSGLKEMYEKVKLAVMISRVLRALGAPENLSLEGQVALLKKIASQASQFSDFAKGAAEIISETGTEGLALAGPGHSRAGKESGLIDKGQKGGDGEASRLGVNNERSLGLEERPLNAGITQKLGLQASAAGLASDYGRELSLSEVPDNAVLEAFEKFLEMIIKNAETMEKMGEVVDSVENLADVESQMESFIDGNIKEMFKKYGVDPGDINAALSVIEGKKDTIDLDAVEAVFELFGSDSKALYSLKETVRLVNDLNSAGGMNEKQAFDMLVRVVNAIPKTAAAIDAVTP